MYAPYIGVFCAKKVTWPNFGGLICKIGAEIRGVLFAKVGLKFGYLVCVHLVKGCGGCFMQ